MRLADKYQHQEISGMTRMFQSVERMIKDGNAPLNLSIGEPDFITEPDIADAACAAAKQGFTHYPPLAGFKDLREAVCAYWARHHNFKADPDEVFITNGGLHAPILLFEALLNPGDEILIFEPYFSPYLSQILYGKAVPVVIKTQESNNFAPTIDDLERAVTPKTRGILLNLPCNPTGKILNLKQLEEIANFAERHDLFVISDEIYESLIFNNKNHICFAGLNNMKERTILIGGLSKSHCMTGWRLGYVICDKNLVNTLCVVSVFHTYGVNTLSQKAAAYALNTQDEKVKQRSKIFADRMNKVAARLNSMKGVTCGEAEGAFYLFPSIKATGLTSEEFSWKLLSEAGVAVVPGSAFGESGEGYIRIACTQSLDILLNAMDRMQEFTNKLSGAQPL